MFKVLLIVYVVGGGGSNSVSNTYNTQYTFQEFNSMEDCELAVKKMDGLVTWYRNDDKEDKISALYSTDCVEMSSFGTAGSTMVIPEDPAIVIPTRPSTPHRQHSRWDD